MIQPPERIVISFVRFSSSLPFLPSTRHSLPLSPFVRDRCVAPIRRYRVLWKVRTPTRPGLFLLLILHLSPSRIIPLPRLVAPLLIESATRRYAAQGFVAHVGVLVCEFRGIVSVDHFPASIGTRGIGSLGARMNRDPLCSRLRPRRALSARVVSLRRSSVCGRSRRVT